LDSSTKQRLIIIAAIITSLIGLYSSGELIRAYNWLMARLVRASSSTAYAGSSCPAGSTTYTIPLVWDQNGIPTNDSLAMNIADAKINGTTVASELASVAKMTGWTLISQGAGVCS